MDPVLATSMLCGFDPSMKPPAIDLPAAVYQLPPGAELLERPSDWPHAYATEHFVVRWGDQALPNGVEADIADALELSWDHQVDALGWEPPRGTEVYKIDVFLGNTHDGEPTIDFDGAYVTTTLAMEPYVVVSPAVVDGYRAGGDPTGSDQVLAHEFNHTLQLGDLTLYAAPRGWFWFEATANWAAASTLQGEREIATWGPFLLHPELALYTFAAIDDFSEPERLQRQYQAAMFVRYLSDHFGEDLIRRSWDEVPIDQASPLPWLDQELDEGIRHLYADFATTHAVGDHPYAALYSEGASYQAYYSENAGVTAWLDPEGGGGTVDAALLPEGFGWNRLAWTALEAATVTFDLRLDAEGDAGSTSDWLATAVVEREGGFEHLPFEGSIDLEVLPGDFVSFVLVSVPDRHADRERFGYSYDLLVTPETRGGCGCDASAAVPSTPTWWSRR